ncbi:MAG: thermonuclease family protein [Bauldia sp.]|nr:thermonuclease family protein [Bauldia sp.]
MPRARLRLRCLMLTMPLVFAGTPVAAETLPGPVAADVIRIVDGDTLALRARVWIGVDLVVSARIRGIDAPELQGKCAEEKAMAAAARDRLASAAVSGRVRLMRIENDKYAGRVVADVVTDDGTDLGAAMLASGLVRPYEGGGRLPWCGLASLGDGDDPARP